MTRDHPAWDAQATSSRRVARPVTLRLATVAALVDGLSHLGLRWEPVPLYPLASPADDDPAWQPGLYVWTVGDLGSPPPKSNLAGWRDAGVLYIGVGEGKQGVQGRVGYEQSVSGADAEHFHGRAMHLLGASPMGGPVERIEVDLDWLSGWVAEEGRCDLAGEGQGRRSPPRHHQKVAEVRRAAAAGGRGGRHPSGRAPGRCRPTREQPAHLRVG